MTTRGHDSSHQHPRLAQLQAAGVSIWLDTLSRELLESGAFGELVRAYSVTGATSNPTILAAAITGSDRYDEQLRSLTRAGVRDRQQLFFALGLEDIRLAAEILQPVHAATSGRDGFVSFECTPDVAYGAEPTIAQASELWQRLGRSNVMIKVPATEPGLEAIEELTAEGVNVNVTLLFSVNRYEQVMEAYLTGLERRVAAGKPVDRLSSVASFFVSRVDAKAQQGLPPDSALRGRVAIANAARAYGRYVARFSGPRWERLSRAGATAQRPLWASTGTKDSSLSDVLYVERLLAPGVVNTMPAATLRAFADHGSVGPVLTADTGAAERLLSQAADQGVDLDAITDELEVEGVRAFRDSYDELLACIGSKLEGVTGLGLSR